MTKDFTRTLTLLRGSRHWAPVWQRAPAISPGTSEEKKQFLRDCLGPQRIHQGFHRSNEVELFGVVALVKKAGACGTDQWYPGETKVIPRPVLKTFWQLTYTTLHQRFPQGDGLSPVALVTLMLALACNTCNIGLALIPRTRFTWMTEAFSQSPRRSWLKSINVGPLGATHWAQRARSQLGSKNGAGMEQLRAVAPQEAVKEQVEVLGVAMTSGKQRKATAKEPSRRHDAAYVNVTSRTGLLPIRRKDKHQTTPSVAMAKAAYGLLTRKPSAAETRKWDQQVWRSCG